MKNILIVEDERSIADTVIHSVGKEGYAATWCMRGAEALERLKEGGFDLVVLDVGLPDISGFELCKAIRKFSAVPIIFLTARDEEIDKIVGLEIGGDDYMTKPFSPRELGARIKSVLRRAGAHASVGAPAATAALDARTAVAAGTGAAARGTLRIDEEKMQVLYHGKRLELTRYEFKLLSLLARHPGRVFSRDALMDQVWDGDSPSLDRTVDAHVKSLRAKCREINAAVDPILTHRGTGYALREDL